MARPPERIASIRQWHGLVSNRSELLGRPGDALVQTNLYSPHPGTLATRRGRRALSFAAAPGGSGNVISCYFLRGPDQDYLITHTDGGDLVLAAAPS